MAHPRNSVVLLTALLTAVGAAVQPHIDLPRTIVDDIQCVKERNILVSAPVGGSGDPVAE